MVTPIIVELVQYDQKGNKLVTGETGIIVSEHLLPVPDEASSSGMRFQAMLGVCWENNRTPAISYHSPEELEWLAVPAVDNLDDEEDEEEADEEETFSDRNTEEETQATY